MEPTSLLQTTIKKTKISVNKTELLLFQTLEKHFKFITTLCKYFSISEKRTVLQYPPNDLAMTQ